jgi:hypothetical protein
VANTKNNNKRVIPTDKTQVNFNVQNDILEKVKNLAFWEQTSQSEIYNASVVKYLELYEKKHGEIKDRPAGNGLHSV